MKEVTLILTISEDAFLGLNNATVLFGDAAYAAYLGCKVPEKLENVDREIIQKRFYALKELYKVIESEFDK